MTDLGPIIANRRDGSERRRPNGESLTASVAAFLALSVSDLISTATRGVPAELIVATALEVTDGQDRFAPTPGTIWRTAHGVRMLMPKATSGPRSYIRLDYRLNERRIQGTAGRDWRAAWQEAQRIDDLLAAKLGDTSTMTVSALGAAWLRARGPDWSPTYREINEQVLARIVGPAIGNVRLRDLNRGHARDLIAEQPSPSGRRRSRALLSSMYSWAIDEQWITRDLRTILPPSGRSTGGSSRLAYVRRETAPATEDVYAIVRELGRQRRYASPHARRDFTPAAHLPLLFLVAGFAGLRQGECWALQGQHVRGDHLRVERQVQRLKGQDIYLPPKHGSTRDVWIPRTVGAYCLRDLLAARAEEVGPEGLLFPAPHGRAYTRANFARDIMIPARAAAWPGQSWTFHDLRHHFCRWHVDNGLAISDVSRLAGHSGVDVTMRLYISANEGIAARAAALYGED
jgi:integrase